MRGGGRGRGTEAMGPRVMTSVAYFYISDSLEAILDEFQRHLYHGKLAPEANAQRINLLLGLDLVDSSAGRTYDERCSGRIRCLVASWGSASCSKER